MKIPDAWTAAERALEAGLMGSDPAGLYKVTSKK